MCSLLTVLYFPFSEATPTKHAAASLVPCGNAYATAAFESHAFLDTMYIMSSYYPCNAEQDHSYSGVTNKLTSL